MLELSYVEEKNKVTELFMRIFGGETTFPDGIIVALVENGKEIGLAVANLYEGGAIVRLIGILPEHRKQKKGDFFTRAFMYMLTVSGIPLYIDYYDAYYEKFGFSRVGEEKMKAEVIVYPSNCGGH
ncbi:MAG: hypothetical protein EOM87_04785 [Clostridia bacterium]|nr:hypothetical protein [Clostridia bacterium]